MASVHRMKVKTYRTYDELAEDYLTQLMTCFDVADTVVDVFDWYDNKDSVKEERRRCSGGADKQYDVFGGRNMPPWKLFLSTNENKAALASFLCNYIEQHAPTRLANPL